MNHLKFFDDEILHLFYMRSFNDMTFDSTGIMASNIGIVYNIHNKL